MPSSILKYFDIARLLGAGVKCPTCSSQRCEQSKWHSKHERLTAASYRPYRCADCNYRFLASAGAAMERQLINGAAVVLVIFGALIAFDIWQETVEQAQAEQLRAVAPAEVGAPAGDVPGDGVKSPLVPAEKPAEQGASGDSGASPAPARKQNAK